MSTPFFNYLPISKLNRLFQNITYQSSNLEYYYSKEATTYKKEIENSVNHLINLLEDWSLLSMIHQNKYKLQLPPILQKELQLYQHRQKIMEFVQPLMLTATALTIDQSQDKKHKSITCPHCQKQFWGKKFWKRYQQHKKDAHIHL